MAKVRGAEARAGRAGGWASRGLVGLWLLLAGAWACEDSKLSHMGQQEDPEPEPEPANNSTNNSEVDIPDKEPDEDTRCCVLVPLGGTRALEVDASGQLVFGVAMFDRLTGEAKPGELVEFHILETEGGASLTERSATTDDEGRGQTRFIAGEELRSYTVRVTSEVSNFVEMTIEVKPLPTGSLEVSYTNAGESVYEVAPIQALVFPKSVFSCEEFRPLSQLPVPTFMDEVRNVERVSNFDDLDVREPWTVIALGKGEFGQVAAAGCQNDVYIRESETTQVELVLSLLPLNPVGRYDVISNWDFTQTLEQSGNVGMILLQIFDAFENPGRFLYDQLINIVQSFLGSIISGAVDFFLNIFGLDDQIEQGINGFIESVDFLSNVRQAGLDLRDMVTHLEVISTLTIGKLGNDYEVYGADDWRGIAVYWRWNCDENAPPDCGRIELALDNDQSLGVVYGEWGGQVAAYNQLLIRPHSVNLRYGQLILFLLNEVLLPALTDGNAHSMTDALLYWINCQGLATSITGSDGEICAPANIVCVSDDSIAGVCNSVIRGVFGFAEVLLQDLQVDSVIELSGQAKLVERNGDLLIDELVEGQYDGWVNFNGTRSPFSATWSGVRLERTSGTWDGLQGQ